MRKARTHLVNHAEESSLMSPQDKRAARTGIELSDIWVSSKFKFKGISKGEKFWMAYLQQDPSSPR